MNEAEEKYVSTGELMDFLSISRATVDRLRQKGMPALRIGAVWRYPTEGVIAWLKTRQERARSNGD